ncbi:MAG: hypothetical protein MJ057_06565 [Sphaerochaetaceae bacterium]|nr:hypothetical protein [Sphaerochaetaceae bacterium]
MKRSNLLAFVLVGLVVFLGVSCATSHSSEPKELPPIRVDVVEDIPRTLVLRANPKRGYYFDCYIFLPRYFSRSEYLLVEASNSGPSERTASQESLYIMKTRRDYHSLTIGTDLNLPVLLAAIPRPTTENPHCLSYFAIHDFKGANKRVDVQLACAIKDALEYLNATYDTNLNEKILMYGHSSGGNFVSRFTFLHPEMVYAMCAGGTQGIFPMPISSYKGYALPYPLGTSDYKSITGHAFSLEDWSQVRMYLYNGDIDDNDSITPNGLYPAEMSSFIFSHIGDSMEERTKTVSEIYHSATENMQTVLYLNTGHQQVPYEDAEYFFRMNIRSEEFVPVTPYLAATEY